MKQLWCNDHPANLAFYRSVTVDQSKEQIYVATGHGQPYAAIRFRQWDLATGEELASAALRDEARCWSISPNGDEIVLCTAKRGYRLNPDGLAVRQRCQSLFPRYANAIARLGEYLIVGTSAAIVSYPLSDGRTKRRRAKDCVGIFRVPGMDGLISCDAGSGDLRHIVHPMDKGKAIATLSPFREARVSEESPDIFLSLKLLPKSPNKVLRVRISGGDVQVDTLEFPDAFQRIEVTPDGKEIYLIDKQRIQRWRLHGDLPEKAGDVSLADSEDIVAVAPKQRIAVHWRVADKSIVISATALQ